MLIDFTAVPQAVVPHFKGGDKEALVRKYEDENGKILILTLQPGASIGPHLHDTSSEMIYVLSGQGTVTGDGAPENLFPGRCHYCPKGHGHSIRNDGTEDLVMFAVVPRQ
ncbi:MAG: cupin domain-containing protein [Clostridiales bacterium]|nr:cupin domain-containing protein [Clostridiales bacterium]